MRAVVGVVAAGVPRMQPGPAVPFDQQQVRRAGLAHAQAESYRCHLNVLCCTIDSAISCPTTLNARFYTDFT